MTWLQKRLKELNYTHHDLQKNLLDQEIKRVRATITGWTNGKPVSLLNNPKHAKILADILNWTVLEMFIAAGYDIAVPKELWGFIEKYNDASDKRKAMYMQNLEFVSDFLDNLTEEELVNPEGEMGNEADGRDE